MGYLDKKIPEFPDSSQIISMSLRRCRHSISECYSLLNKAQPLYLWASFDKTSYVKMVGLGGLEPPTSPLSEVCSIACDPYSKAFYTILEIYCPVFAPI